MNGPFPLAIVIALTFGMVAGCGSGTAHAHPTHAHPTQPQPQPTQPHSAPEPPNETVQFTANPVTADSVTAISASSRYPSRTTPAPGHPWIIAHRGGTEQAPQNSMAAFNQAIALKVNIIETDVRHTADGVAVLIHDPTLPKPCTPFAGAAVHNLTSAQLATVRCSGQPIPHLAELVARMRRPDATAVALMPEIKDTDPLGVRDAVAALGWSRVYLQSFDLPALAGIERASPEVTTCALISTAQDVAGALAVTRDCVMSDWQAIDQPMVARVHAAGAAMVAYTVNSPDTMRTLAGAGVDGIVTDKPHLAFRAIRQRTR